MKKKILSIFTVICLLMPCLFLVACKEKEPQKQVKAYTYSVVLKNAKDKIDESLLSNEYDYAKSKNVGYSLDGNDYKLSVTKQVKLNGSFEIALLEGFDYSDAKLTVNGEDTQFSISANGQTDVANNVVLDNRTFKYSYKNMNADTNIVVDFSNCALVDVEIDVTALAGKGVKYKVVEDGFLTMQDGVELVKNLNSVNQNKITVKYGSVVAFDYSERLATQTTESESQDAMKYASYGLRYLKNVNLIQYFVAKTDVKCDSYSQKSNNNQIGTLRVPYSLGLNVATSLTNLNNQKYLAPAYDTEAYGTEEIKVEIYSGNTLYIEIDDNNNYFLLDYIDEKMESSNSIKTESGKNYLKIELSSGGKFQTKYLTREDSKRYVNCYFVCASSLSGFASVTNADYILFGKNIPSEFQDENIVYVFGKDKDVQLQLNQTIKDNEMVIEKEVTSVKIGSNTYYPSLTPEITLAKTDLTSSSQTSQGVDVYSLSLYATVKNLSSYNFVILFENLQLYSGETLYYSTNIKDAFSWKKYESEEELIDISQNESGEDGEIVYYYIDSERADTKLSLLDKNGEETAINSNAVDCFGRYMKGTITVDGKAITLSRVCCLNVIPSEHDTITSLYISRHHDMHDHKINVDADVQTDDIMISIGSYAEGSFGVLLPTSNLSINTNSSYSSFIYYYVKGETNRHLVLKNSNGEVVSKSQLVSYQGVPHKIDGKFVYRLALNQESFDEDEEFSLSIEKSTYGLMYGEVTMQLYSSASPNADLIQAFAEGVTYHFLEESLDSTDAYFQIVDEDGNVIVAKDQITISGTSNSGALKYYAFTLELSDSSLYVPGTKFYLQKITPTEA